MISKYEKIKVSRAKTREKRKVQICKTFELKLNISHIKKDVIEQLNRLFVEAKWFYNDVLRSEKIYECKSSKKSIVRLDKDKNEIIEELKVLLAAPKQSIIDQIKSNIKTLNTLKKKGKKVGHLRFVSELNSVGLTNQLFKFINKKVKIRGFKKAFNIYGFKQFPQGCEFASAKLIKKPTGFFLKVTTFIDKEKEQKQYKNKSIGLDFGIKTSVTTSHGEKINCSIKESERLKKLQRSFSKKQKRSNNWFKDLLKIQKEYLHLSNQKNDISNKIVHNLLRDNELIVIQDDNLNSWKKKKKSIKKNNSKKKVFSFGKKIQSSCLGRIKAKLKSLKDRVITIGQFEPTTKRCGKCGCVNNNLHLGTRIFECPSCGHQEDRDVHAAKNIEMIGLEGFLSAKNSKKNRSGRGQIKACGV